MPQATHHQHIHRLHPVGQKLRAIALFVALGAVGLSAFAQEKTPLSVPAAAATAQNPVKLGQYLSIAADCAACHTVPGSSKLFAGGYAIASPMGNIYASNITPSRQFGIGAYTEAQFARAVREGIDAHGNHLYPAMPYPSYARMTDADVSALYAYFMGAVKPVDEPAPATRLPFPFNMRFSMLGWNMLFLDKQRDSVDRSKSVEWNRGNYLVNTLAHCSECHTPRNAMMALADGKALYSGAQLGSWHAPNITSDKVSGIGGWSDDQLRTYLKTGHVNLKAQAAGPMAEAITNSLQYLSESDIGAIITYLRTVPAVRTPGQTRDASSFGGGADSDADIIGKRTMQVDMATMSGKELYQNVCASCHQVSGKGTPDGFYPALMHNSATGGASPDNLLATILFGVEREAGGKQVLMPAFGADSEVQQLSDRQVADLANYLFQQHGNGALTVTEQDVATVRGGGPRPAIAVLSNPLFLGLAAVVVLILLAVALVLGARIRRSRRRMA